MTNPASRPSIQSIADAETFAEWYWLKSELIAFCRAHGLPSSGSKADITQRIYNFKSGAITITKRQPQTRLPKNGFDWHKHAISTRTEITETYKNTQNVRRFFEQEIGERFKFNIEFMDWMRGNPGKTMGDAADHWRNIEQRRKDGVRSEIPQSNQFNRFVRDYFDAQPNATMDQARALWADLRSKPGPNRYSDIAS